LLFKKQKNRTIFEYVRFFIGPEFNDYNLSIYPNPTSDILKVSGLNSGFGGEVWGEL